MAIEMHLQTVRNNMTFAVAKTSKHDPCLWISVGSSPKRTYSKL